MNVNQTAAATAPVRSTRRPVLVVLGTAFLAAFILSSGTALANAGTANSTVGVFTVAGTQYQNYATIITSTSGSGSANAYTATGPVSATVGPGYVGSRGRLFTSGGALSCEGSNSYNSVSLIGGGYWSAISCGRTGHAAWYSFGVSLAFNGTGYNSVYTFHSPNQNS